jgi:asparagine synthase (glutamine-hydrolysing)
MPGLVGIVWNNKGDEPLLDKMANSIKHEEWHRVDKYSDSFFGAARVSLGIFNPDPQPIFNEDKTLCIFLYGKVYEYEREVNKLRNRGHQFTVGNDTEFCLHSYEEYGKDFIKELNGSFVFAIYDVKQRRIIIANDRYGFRPLYYAMSGGKILFASEVKAILEDNAFKKELDDRAIADFFAFGEILGNKTFFNGIETLPPASVLTYDEQNISIEQYWDFRYQPDYSLSQDEMVDQLVQTFRKAVDIRMRDNLRYGVALSGGLDSRVVLAAIDKSQRHRVTGFTFGVPDCSDIRVAKMVAQKAGIDHLIIELDPDELVAYAEEVVHLADGMDAIDVAFLPYAIGRAREQVDVSFNGLALDLTLGGSFLNQSILNADSDEELLKIWYKKMALFPPKLMASLFVPEYYSKIEEMPLNSLAEALHNATAEHPGNKSDYFSIQNHVRRLTILGSVISRNKLEEALPTFDNDFIGLVLKIPPELRFNHRIHRKFLMKLAPELAAIPYQRTMVPASAPLVAWTIGSYYQGGKQRLKRLIWRSTEGKIYLPDKGRFVNLDEWLRLNERWRGFVRGLLLDDKACSRGYFNKDYIETMIQEHESGKVDHSLRLTYLATFELFLRMFTSG